MNRKIKIVNNKWSHILRLVLGYFFIVFGVISFSIIIIPGWLFILLGIFVLGGDKKTRDRIFKFFPKKYRVMLEKYFQKIYQKK